MKIIYCVSIEDDSSGAVHWYKARDAANHHYNEALVEFPNDEINLFFIKVANNTTKAAITNAVDGVMWDREYTPLRWRAGNNHSALPHATPPTD